MRLAGKGLSKDMVANAFSQFDSHDGISQTSRAAGVIDYYLEARDESGNVTSHPIDRLPFSIGRGPDNELVIPHSSVSRRHAYIWWTEDGLTIVDNGSRNGIFVNRQRVATMRILRDGDVVDIGAVRFRVRASSSPKIPESSNGTETIQFFAARQVDPIQSFTTHVARQTRRRRTTETTPQEPANFQSLIRLFLEAPLPQVYEKILNAIEDRVTFDRCFIISLEQGNVDELKIVAQRMHRREDVGVIVSREILKRVVQRQESVAVKTSDASCNPSRSFMRSGAAMAVCVPLVVNGDVTGVIYLDRCSGDEDTQSAIEALGPLAGLAALKIENVRLLEHHIVSQMLERDLKLAKEIMRNLQPSLAAPRPTCSIEGHTEACYDVGGDYYDFIFPSDHELIVVIGDVSGKALPAALYVSGARAALHAHIHDGLEIDAIMSRLERHVRGTFRPDHFLTLFIGRLDLESGILRYCSAGHMPAICVRSQGDAFELQSRDPALNIIPWDRFECHELPLEPGDILFLYTDGITEAASPAGEQYGIERLTATLREGRDLDLVQLRDRILADVDSFSRECPARDDKTLVLVRRT